MESPREALDHAEHRDRRVCPELPVHYPKLVVERFVSRPLRDRGSKGVAKKKKKENEERINGLSLAARLSQRGEGEKEE